MNNKNKSIIKIILIIFFLIFFGFLFYYLYEPLDDKKTNKGNFFTDNLFPFGDVNDFNNNDKKKNNNNDKKNIEIKEKRPPQLRQITSQPTSAAIIESISKLDVFDINKDRKKIDKLDENTDYFEIRYILSKNSHVYSTYNFTEEVNRIINTTILKSFDVKFINKDKYFLRYKNDFGSVKLLLGYILDKSKEEIDYENKNIKNIKNIQSNKKFDNLFFPDNIDNYYINKESNKIFYTTFNDTQKKGGIKIDGIISDINGENKKKIFSSKLKEWNFSFNNINKILAVNKTSNFAKSIPFSLSIKNASMSKIKKAEYALNALPNSDFSKIIYTKKDDDGVYNLIAKDIKSKKEINLNKSTFIEKCIWSKNNIDVYCAVPINFTKSNQLDNWYKGRNYFKDDIVKINTNSGESEFVIIAVSLDYSFDIIDLKIDDTERFLYWKDKKSDFIWSYDIYYF